MNTNNKPMLESPEASKNVKPVARPFSDWLLIFGVALSPVTALAIGPLNIGECLVLLWSIQTIFRLSRDTFVFQFDLYWWLAFLSALVLGTVVGIIATPSQTDPFQLLTWVYFGIIFISVATGLSARPQNEIESILSRIGIYSIIVHTILLIFSYIVSPNLAGISLWYGDGARFSGGGDNPHYVSLVSLVSIFIVFRLLIRVRGIKQRLGLLLLLICGIWIAWETVTTTILTSALATIGLLVTIYVIQAKRISALWILYVLAGLLAVFQLSSVLRIAENIILSDPNGEGRLSLWLSYFETFEPIHILGLGPGTHAWDGTAEYHNLYLDLLSMGGFLAGALFLTLIIYSLKKSTRLDILLAGPLLALIFYGFGGFSGRRLVFWVVFAVIIALARKAPESSK